MTTNTQYSLRAEEPMCALDPLLFIPRIEYVEAILSCIESNKTSYTLVILDMKNFHLINDIYDYNTGDQVLSAFILLLRARLPKGSISLRFRHGDEFLFFLPLHIDEANGLFADFNVYCEQYSFLKGPDGSDFIISFRFALLALDQSETDYRKILSLAESKLRVVKGPGSLRSI